MFVVDVCRTRYRSEVLDCAVPVSHCHFNLPIELVKLGPCVFFVYSSCTLTVASFYLSGLFVV